MSNQYRTKPVVIEARQWNGGAVAARPIITWILAEGGTVGRSEERPEIRASNGELVQLFEPENICIHTLEGDMTASAGDWIIKGVQGEFYSIKPDVFEATYEAV